MKPVGPVVEKILRKNNLWKGYLQYKLLLDWADIVGPGLAEVTNAKKISNGVMMVTVKDSVWAYHLALMRRDLIGKLNNYVGTKIIKDIYFHIGELK